MRKDVEELSAASVGSAMRYASVCDGIGAAHVAWQPLGWQCQWTSEIEPFPAAVVEQRFGFVNVGDMTKITEETLDAHGPVDLLVGGTPCQSFSVAGLRGGLADPRGNLALRFVQLAAVMQPKWIVWENVPGVLSSGKGRDFATFLGALGELGYGFAYRVLDAQWFGVAQRRRRVFVVGHLGDWRRAAAVLFERESVFGNPPTRGATGQGITSSPQGIAGNVSSKWAKGTGGPAGDECYNLVAFQGGSQQDQVLSGDAVCSALCHSSNGNKGHHQPKFVVPYTKAKRAQSNTDDETWVPGEVSPTMSCFDQGDTRATTVVATPIDIRQSARGDKDTNNRLDGGPPGTGLGGEGDPAFTVSERGQAVAQGFTYSGYSNQPAWMTGDRTDCLPASGHSDGSHQGVGVVLPFGVDFQNCAATGDVSGTIMGEAQKKGGEAGHGVTVPPMQVQWASGGGQTENPTMQALRANAEYNYQFVRQAMAVRRLTPRECERLQGFPDDYTLVEYRKKPAADGPRYRALGNSMAVPVMRWIGERIQQVDRL
jgi:DNA (cytosine-5)-methyltransferase 1